MEIKPPFRLVPRRTYLVAAAIHRDPRLNGINRISCRFGTPIGGYSFDAVTDSYVYDCYEYVSLGYLPASLVCSVPEAGWEASVPLHADTLTGLMSESQKADLENFQNHFGPPDFRVEYVQMLAAG